MRIRRPPGGTARLERRFWRARPIHYSRYCRGAGTAWRSAGTHSAPRTGALPPRWGNRGSQTTAAALLGWLGWRIEGEIPDAPRCVVVGAPHTSNWDLALTLVTALALGVRVSWVGKHSLFRGPAGSVLRALGGVSVNRSAAQGFVAAMVQEFGRRERFVLAIMPQGSRFGGQPWKTGVYHIARGADVPITFAAFDYGNKVMRFGPTWHPSGDLDAEVAEIIAVAAPIRGKFLRPQPPARTPSRAAPD